MIGITFLSSSNQFLGLIEYCIEVVQWTQFSEVYTVKQLITGHKMSQILLGSQTFDLSINNIHMIKIGMVETL